MANHFNCNVSTIHRLRQRYEATNSCSDRPRTGRPRVTTNRQDRGIVRQHLREPFQSASETARATYGTHQRAISDDTVRRRLSIRGLHCRRPARGPIMTRTRRQNRLHWAQQRINWRHREWRRILFTDESRFCSSVADGRQRIWRRRRTRYAANNVMERDPWGGPNVMVWGAITLHRRLDLVVFQNLAPGRGNGVTAQRYINQVLEPRVVPFLRRHPNSVLQQDNARPHTARATTDFLRRHGIHTLPWPAYSPDLNPCLLYTSPSPRDLSTSRMPSSA